MASTSDKLPIPSISKYLEHPGGPSPDFRHWFLLFERFLIMMNANRSEQHLLTAQEKNSYLLMMLGTEGSRIFSANPAAWQIDTLGYTEFSTAVKQQFAPRINVTKACFEFNKRDQLPYETVSDYLTALRHLSADCSFENQTNRNIAIRLICGCKDLEVKKKLLAITEPDLQTVISLMEAEETAKANAEAMKPSDYATVDKIDRRNQGHLRQRKQGKKFACYGCSSTRHTFKSDECPAKKNVCRNCQKTGHFASVCNSEQKFKICQPVEENSSDSETSFDEEAALRNIKNKTDCIMTEIGISNGSYFVPVKIEVDTGAGPTTLQESVYKKCLSKLPLKQSTQVLTNFDGLVIKGSLGVIDTKIKLLGRIHRDFVTIVPDSHSSLLGRNFLKPLGILIDCSSGKLTSVPADKKNALQKKLPQLYRPTSANNHREYAVNHCLPCQKIIESNCPTKMPQKSNAPRVNIRRSHANTVLVNRSSMNTCKPRRTFHPQQPSFQISRPQFCIGDWVVSTKPRAPKSFSQLLVPKRVIRVLGQYTFQLNDGSIWNARKLKRYYPEEWNVFQSAAQYQHPIPPIVWRSTYPNFGNPMFVFPAE